MGQKRKHDPVLDPELRDVTALIREADIIYTGSYYSGWTSADHLASLKEGWILTNDAQDKIAIAKVDDPPAWPEFETGEITYEEPLFQWDEDAVAFVIKRAREGAEHAFKALLLTGMSCN